LTRQKNWKSSSQSLARRQRIVFWLSPGNAFLGSVCLLQSCHSDDGSALNFDHASTYTLLQSLVYFFRQSLRSSILAPVIPNESHPNPYARVDHDHPPSLVAEFHNVKDFLYEFITSPDHLLRQWGCLLSLLREITSLYQVREFGAEAAIASKRSALLAIPSTFMKGP
jgi:hypothetical protein